MNLTVKQRSVLLGEVAYLIVHKKDEMIIVMNKSGIPQVNNKTPNKVVGRLAIEELNKNKLFVKNLSALITDTNLKQQIAKQVQNADGETTGVNVQDAISFGGKILEGVTGLASTLGIGKKSREDAKTELDTLIANEQVDKDAQEKLNGSTKTTGKFTTTGIVLSLLGASALIWIGTIIYKKYAK